MSHLRHPRGRRLALASAIALAVATAPALAAPVSGRITDASGTAGFQGAIVSVVELNRSAVSDREGRFRFPDLPAGSYTLRVQFVGAPTVSQRVEVGNDPLDLGAVVVGADVPVLENVLVVGQLAGQAAALNIQRSADSLRTVVSADAIGQFPDQNVAESLQRLPGLSLARDQGEGRFVVIRGLNPALNTTTINGVRVPGPEDDSRQVNLDVISSDLLETLEVTKVTTPDMDGDAIGGNIEIKSLSAFDRGGRSITGRVEASYNELRSTTNPKAAISFTDIFDFGDDNRFGVAASLSWFNREFGSDGIESATDFLEDPDGEDVIGIAEAEQRNYSITRERLSANLNFDWRLGDSTRLHWRNLFSRFTDEEVQLTNVFVFDDGDVESLDDSGGVFSDATVEKLTEGRTQTQDIFATSFGGEFQAGQWNLGYNLAYAYASTEETDSFGGAWVLEGVDLGYDYADGRRRPRLFSPDPALFNDASAYELDEIALEPYTSKEDEVSFTFDAERGMDWSSHGGSLKFGAKARLRGKDADFDSTVFEGFGDDFFLSDFGLANVRYPFGDFGPIASRRALEQFIASNGGNFEINEADTAIERLAADYDLDEDIYAAYAMGTFDFESLRLITGVRVEQTRYDSRGTQLLIDEELGSGDPEFLPVEFSKRYTDWLPSLILRWEASENVVVRASANRTIARPNFADSAPFQIIEIEEDDGEFERVAELGNPDLDPLRSTNVDASIEYYPGDLTVLSAGVFYKRISDFVVLADVAGTGAFEDFDEALQPLNGDRATVKGLELAWTQKLEFLPAPFDGLMISANYTYVDSESELPFRPGETVPLPLQSDQIANLSIGYEKRGLSLRLSGTYRSEFFEEVNDLEDATFDRYADSNLQVDFSAKYRLSDSFQVYLNAVNLTDEPFYAYFGNRRYNSQFEQYGRTYELGLQYNF
jgi:TonB-dependent receptor